MLHTHAESREHRSHSAAPCTDSGCSMTRPGHATLLIVLAAGSATAVHATEACRLTDEATKACAGTRGPTHLRCVDALTPDWLAISACFVQCAWRGGAGGLRTPSPHHADRLDRAGGRARARGGPRVPTVERARGHARRMHTVWETVWEHAGVAITVSN